MSVKQRVKDFLCPPSAEILRGYEEIVEDLRELLEHRDKEISTCIKTRQEWFIHWQEMGKRVVDAEAKAKQATSESIIMMASHVQQRAVLIQKVYDATEEKMDAQDTAKGEIQAVEKRILELEEAQKVAERDRRARRRMADNPPPPEVEMDHDIPCPNCKSVARAYVAQGTIVCPTCGSILPDNSPSSEVEMNHEGSKEYEENERYRRHLEETEGHG